jgi:predicted SprT family Zn-dependent metalloprotease
MTTILHEIGHLFAGISADHGKVWQDTCYTMGLENAEQEAEQVSYKVRRNAWTTTCEKCGKTYNIARLTARRKRGGSICQCGSQLPSWSRTKIDF